MVSVRRGMVGAHTSVSGSWFVGSRGLRTSTTWVPAQTLSRYWAGLKAPFTRQKSGWGTLCGRRGSAQHGGLSHIDW